MKVGYFDTKEFESRDGQDSPYELVVQGRLLALLNGIRSRFEKPILVNSGYRSPEHNKAVGGVPGSYHTMGLAADIRPVNLDDLAELQQICIEMNTLGGVGLYDTFVHVDCRGVRSRWDNRK